MWRRTLRSHSLLLSATHTLRQTQNTAKDAERELSIISRVVVHPKYRTIGLSARLVRETLAKAGTPHVEIPAVMVKYNPFTEKPGNLL